jgi:hypothetical protein
VNYLNYNNYSNNYYYFSNDRNLAVSDANQTHGLTIMRSFSGLNTIKMCFYFGPVAKRKREEEKEGIS